jgi:hypothetical protein
MVAPNPPPPPPPPLDQQQNDNNCIFEGICALLYVCHFATLWNVIVFYGPQNECILYRYSYVNVCIIHACASSSSSTPPKNLKDPKLTCFVSWVVGHWCNKVGEWVLVSKKSWCFVVLSCAQVFHTCFSSLICCLVCV